MLTDPTSCLPGDHDEISPAALITVAEALRLVPTWSDLTPTRRRDLVSALTGIARMSGLPAGNVVLTPGELRERLPSWSPATYGITLATMRNLLSGLRFVMRRLDLIDRADGPLCGAWSALLAPLGTLQRAGLIGIARFCTARGITPQQFDANAFTAFEQLLTARTLAPRPRKAASAALGHWNLACAIPGWPTNRIVRPADQNQYILPPAAFTDSFQRSSAEFRAEMMANSLETDFDLLSDDVPLSGSKPVRATTADLRESHCRWAASALVATGVPIGDIVSLASLLTPLSRAKDILRFLLQRNAGVRSTSASHVADVLRIIARHHLRLPPRHVAQIREWGKHVRVVYKEMTEKNKTYVRHIASSPERMETFRNLPGALMKAAQDMRRQNSAAATSTACRAVAIEILSKMPLRLANIAGLRLDRHLRRNDPARGRYTYLSIDAAETKNNRAILMLIPSETARMIAVWIKDFRPAVADPACLYLFPGHGTGNRPMSPQGLREAIEKAMDHHLGVPLSPHQFRHLAARIKLDVDPGHHEEVRQLLGHASLATTARHYCGTESESAALRHDEILLGRRKPKTPTKPTKPKKPSGHGGSRS